MASWPDVVNGLFELSGGFFLLTNVLQILRDRTVRGVHWIPFAFFSAWGLWNLYYYPHLGQWWSFWGGVFLVLVNLTYLALLLRYWPRTKEEPDDA